jgi:murein L,D-transpeptidase YcbB/YkuD
MLVTGRMRYLRWLAGVSFAVLGVGLAAAGDDAVLMDFPAPDAPARVLIVDMAAEAPGRTVFPVAPDVTPFSVPLPEAPAAVIAEAQRPDGAVPPPPAEPGPLTPVVAAEVEIPPPDLPPVVVVIDVPAPVAVVLPLPEDPATVLAVAQDAFAVLLRDRLAAATPLPRTMARIGQREREAMAAFYGSRDYRPLWLADGQSTPGASAVTSLLSAADEDGLDPAAYPIAALASERPEARVEAELSLTAAALAYARDARGGRLEPTRLSSMVTPDLELPDPAAVLTALSQTTDPASLLAQYHPHHEGYVALKAKLRELRDATASVAAYQPPALEGPVLRLGDADPRVPLLRSRLDLEARADTSYDNALAEAVKALQRRYGMRATGVFDPRTAELLDSPGARARRPVPAADIIANMERWRWVPSELGERHIMVNLPEFTLRLVDEGRVVHRARVIIGKPETQTPVFSHKMEHVIVNPSWHIPPSIMKKEILPGLARDPDYAAKRGYQVLRRGNTIFVRQPPGERNALGFIKFMFPNQHAVYLHDTPARGLFANDRRALSHGCVRVDQPFQLAEFVLGAQGYTEGRLRAMIGSGERTIGLKQQLPVHITYFTVFVDEAGRLQRREDLYGHDGRVRTALGIGADGRRFAHLN